MSHHDYSIYRERFHIEQDGKEWVKVYDRATERTYTEHRDRLSSLICDLMNQDVAENRVVSDSTLGWALGFGYIQILIMLVVFWLIFH